MSVTASTDPFDFKFLSKEKKEVFEFFGDWVFILDDNQQKIVYSNGRFASLFGYNLTNFREIETAFIPKLYTSATEQLGIAALEKLRKNEATELLLEVVAIASLQITLRLKITPIEFSESTHRYFLIVAEKRNLNEEELLNNEKIKELEAQLLQANKSNADLEQFAYVASHDLSEPLRKIISFGEQLESRFSAELPAEAKFLLGRMTNATLRMAQLIDDLLKYSRISNGESNPEQIDLNDLLNQVIETLEPKIKEKNASIGFEKLPLIDGIKPQLMQLFQNLLSNSLKFSNPTHNLHVQIEVTKVENNNENSFLLPMLAYYKFEWRDNGIGFEQKYAHRIFELFQRLHGRSAYEGTGLGLAICQKIVANHHGAIEAFGEENKGATFVFYLPEKQLITNY